PTGSTGRTDGSSGSPANGSSAPAGRPRQGPDDRRRRRELQARERRIADLENRIAEREQAVRDLEAQMAAPDFYSDRASAEDVISRHQALMWEVGDLMQQWEALQAITASDSPV